MAAMQDFQTGLSEVRVLFELRSAAGSATADGQAATDVALASAKDNALFRSCVVLLVSHFESFLKGIAEEFIDELDTGTLESRRIPRGIRELHTIPRLSEILTSSADDQREALLKRMPQVMSLWNDGAKPSRGTLSGRTLSRRVTNAQSETIDSLFKLMGHREPVCDGDIDIVSVDDDHVPTNIRLGLRDVVKCRNDIAHGDLERRPTELDVLRYLDFLAVLANRLQRKHAALLSSIC